MKEPDLDGKAQRPQLYVVEPRIEDYVEICTDSLSLRGYQEYKCNDYHLGECDNIYNFFLLICSDCFIFQSIHIPLGYIIIFFPFTRKTCQHMTSPFKTIKICQAYSILGCRKPRFK